MTRKEPSPKPSQVRAREKITDYPTRAQLGALKAFAVLSEKLGKSPTTRELSAKLGLSSNGAQKLITQLTDKGLLRAITEPVVVARELTDNGKAWLEHEANKRE